MYELKLLFCLSRCRLWSFMFRCILSYLLQYSYLLGTSTLPLIDFSSDLLLDVKKRHDVPCLLSAEERRRRQHNTNTFFSKGRPQKHYMNIDFWSSNELVNPLLFLADLGRCGDFVGCTSLAVRKACAVHTPCNNRCFVVRVASTM